MTTEIIVTRGETIRQEAEYTIRSTIDEDGMTFSIDLRAEEAHVTVHFRGDDGVQFCRRTGEVFREFMPQE